MHLPTPTTRGALPLSTLAAGLAMAAGGSHAAVITSSGPVVVPAGTPGTVPGSVVSNIGGIGLQVQNFFQVDSSMSVSLGISTGFLHKSALAGGTDLSSVAYDFPFNGQTSLTLVQRTFNAGSGTWDSFGQGHSFLANQLHNYYGFRFNTGAGDRYGWIDIQATAIATSPSSPFGVTINGWAYDDSGASLIVPGGTPVPEPGALSLVAAGLALAGAATRRRRQRQRQAA